jgi:hypothetical protein
VPKHFNCKIMPYDPEAMSTIPNYFYDAWKYTQRG